ncbi:MAG: HU family DNA-binding protein [Candidatus Zixiibacteriota bacterium]
MGRNSRRRQMTKADLVEKVAERTGLMRTDVSVVVDSFLDTVKKTLEGGHNIEIRGFGTFKIKLRKSRKARNPRTGEVVPVPDRKVPVFKPSNEFKNMITKLPLDDQQSA